MCGITGYANLKKAELPGEKVLRAMNESLTHRGPDDQGCFFGDFVALAQRRLSIIDLSTGKQPIFNEDGSVAIVFNGEIYNFKKIRTELEKTGRHVFKTECDTEVIVHLYEEKGPECLPDLNGMFAFVIWDAKNQRIFCARDRMGQKPFYYAVMGDHFIFGSELKALMKHPELPRRLDEGSLVEYLAFEYVPAPGCILKGVNKLEPGHYFVIDFNDPLEKRREIKTKPYWDIPFNPDYDRSFEDTKKGLIEVYQRAVERRLISDVPLGVFLSGGIDSSSVVAMMARKTPPKDIKTFCVAFREKTFDESTWSRRVAGHFGTDHYEETLPPERLLEILPSVCGFLDEPMADPSIIPTYLLSEFTRKRVTVALGGDGGDELFAGYDPFQAHNPSRFLEKLPRFLVKGMEKAAGALPVSTKNISFDFKIKQFLSGMEYSYGKRHFAWLGSFKPGEQEGLLSSRLRERVRAGEAYRVIDDYLSRLPQGGDPLDGIIYLYCKLYLQDDILVKVDRASMACSLEARAPFLDPEVVEYAGTIPNKWKLKGFTTKYVLKKALEPYLPHDIIYRKKKGFGIPIAAWFKGPLKNKLRELLSEKKLKSRGLFDPAFVKKLMTEHFEGKRDNRKRLWTLFIFQNWMDHYMN